MLHLSSGEVTCLHCDALDKTRKLLPSPTFSRFSSLPLQILRFQFQHQLITTMSDGEQKKIPIEVPREEPEKKEPSFAERDLQKSLEADALLKKEPDNKAEEPDMVLLQIATCN